MRARHLTLPAAALLAACNALTKLDELPGSDGEMGGEPLASAGGRKDSARSGGASGGASETGGSLGSGGSTGGEGPAQTGGSGDGASGGSRENVGGMASGGGEANSGGMGGDTSSVLPELSLLDSFDAPESSANWVDLGDFIIIDGVLTIPAASPSYIFFKDAFDAPQAAAVKLVETGGNSVIAVGLTLLATGSSCDLIRVEYWPAIKRLEVYKCIESTTSLVATKSFVMGDGQTLAGRVVPAKNEGEYDIDVFVDGYLELSVTTKFPNGRGRIGVRAEFPNPASQTPRFDDFAGGSL